MKLKVGDVVEFKKYEDMTDDESAGIGKNGFVESGKVTEIYPNGCFFIEESPYCYSESSVARVISDVDVNSLNIGDEVLIKVKIGEMREGHIWVSWVDKDDVVKVLKRKEPEHFIVKEDHYGMYVNGSGVLIADKRHAKVYNSRVEANDDAADMHLNAWDVIPYDD